MADPGKQSQTGGNDQGKTRRTTPVRENPGERPGNLRKREEWFRKRSGKP